MFPNKDSNGRFHSDWLSMMYSRLKLARNLLKKDGAIFISIDDNEQVNLKKLCDEVFGDSNFIASIACINKPSGRSDDKYVATAHEYILIYMRSSAFEIGEFDAEEHIIRRYTKVDTQNEVARKYREEDLRKRGSHDERIDRPNLFYPFFYSEESGDFYIGDNSDETPQGYLRIEPMKSNSIQGTWRWGKETANEKLKYLHPKYMSNKGQWSMFQWEYLDERSGVKPTTHWNFKDVNSERGTGIFKELGFSSKIFQNPKPIGTIGRILKLGTKESDIILDFFSGSASTAHAVMQHNSEDKGKRKFIMVQLPEICDEKSEAFKAGYKTIAEISKERIRRAGKKIKEENPEAGELDTGFRVLKIDSSNIKNIYYTPEIVSKDDLFNQVEHIKSDRTSEDLLFQVMLDWGVDLSLPIRKESIEGKEIYFVNDDDLIACFDKDIDEPLIKALAAKKPLRVVFRDDGFASDSLKINVEQIFKQLAPATDIKAI